MTVLLTQGLNILKDIGGARVFRPFVFAGKHVKPGDEIGVAELKTIPNTNLRCLIEGRFLIPWPKQSNPNLNAKRFVIPHPGGGFDVVSGEKLNDTVLNKDEALALAGQRRRSTEVPT